MPDFCRAGTTGTTPTTGYDIHLLVNGVPVRAQRRIHSGMDETPITGHAELVLQAGDTVQIRVSPISRITYQAQAGRCFLTVRQLRHFA